MEKCQCNKLSGNTFHQKSFRLVHIFEADDQSLSEGINHCEDHPNLNQLDVGGGWEGLADPKETETITFSTWFCFNKGQKALTMWLEQA